MVKGDRAHIWDLHLNISAILAGNLMTWDLFPVWKWPC